MTHEIKQLFQLAESWQKVDKKVVLITVVALDGSSYRRPGVRMLINDAGDVNGAVSGGCIEKEIHRQAKSVFQTGKAKMMTYDGRLRLGCEGILYILIEPIFLTDELLKLFYSVLNNRLYFEANSFYVKENGTFNNIGSQLILSGKSISLHPNFQPTEKEKFEYFTQSFAPLFQLYVFGAELDAVQLCKAAHNIGWEITIVADPAESKTLDYFPGASSLISPTFENIDTKGIDDQTAIILMTHSFNKDVRYLLALKDVYPAYFGLLGPPHRRERILAKFLEYHPEISTEFLDQLYAPAGINIGAETASEIVISIIAEILGTIRNQKPMALRDKIGNIHG